MNESEENTLFDKAASSSSRPAKKPDVPELTVVKWQRIVNLTAAIFAAPAGLIMRVDPPEIEVFLASLTEGNPYKKGERADLNTGLYCEKVMAQRFPLLVPDALKDPVWDHNPDIEMGMVFYLGFPIQWPDGEIFGTICVLDSKKNQKAVAYWELLADFKELVEADLGSLIEINGHRRVEEALKLNQARLEALHKLNQMSQASLQEICDFALEQGVSLTKSRYGYLYFMNEDESELTIYAWSSDVVDMCTVSGAPSVYQVRDTGLWGEAVRQRRPIITNEYEAPSPYKKGLPEGHVHLARHMNTPVLDDEGRIVAVAGVANKNEPYDEADVRQLQLLMDGMWGLVQHKRAEEELDKYRQDLEELVRARTGELTMANKRLHRKIDDHMRAEEELRQAENKFRTLFNSASDAIFIHDLEGRFLEVNDIACERLGYQREELLTMTPRDIDVPEFAEEVTMRIEELIRKGQITIETAHAAKHGSVIPTEVNAKAIEYLGQPAIISIARDITNRKQAEEKILAYQDQLRSLASKLSSAEERERRRIAADLHDKVCQTLTGANIKLNSLKKLADSPQMSQKIMEAVGLVEEAIEDTRSLIIEISPPVLYELGLEAALDELADQIQQEYGLEIEIEDDGQPKPLDSETLATLYQTVRELLINVVKHAQATLAKVLISLVNEDIKITVTDNGIGMDPEVIDSPLTRTRSFGLFNIREHLSWMGGRMNIESRPDQGTTITLWKPL